MLIPALIEQYSLVEAVWWCGDPSPSLKGWSLSSLRREMSRWGSTTGGPSICPQSGTELHPPRWRRWYPQSGVDQRQRGWNRLPAVLTPISSGVLSCWSHQHNRVYWLVTKVGWRMGCHPTAVSDQADDQHEEELPGCVQLFHTLPKLLSVQWTSCLRLESSQIPHASRGAEWTANAGLLLIPQMRIP